MINEKKKFLTVSWLSGLLAEIFISTDRWMGGPDATTDRWKQSSSAVRVSGGCPGNVMWMQIDQGRLSSMVRWNNI